MELRHRVRYRLTADAVFTWTGAKQNKLSGGGITRDISLTGAFIFTRTCPPVGTTIELEIFLSQLPTIRGRTVQIKTEARVIRVEHSDKAEGFAAVSQDFTLLFDKEGNSFSVSSFEDYEGKKNEESKHAVPTKAHLNGMPLCNIPKRLPPV